MAEEDNRRGNIYSANDTLDINELASLNDDISTEFIEQLQNQVAQNASAFTGKPIYTVNDDSELFEEIDSDKQNEETNQKPNSDDDFIKKYKSKANKQNETTAQNKTDSGEQAKTEGKKLTEDKKEPSPSEAQTTTVQKEQATPDGEIENLTSGNIIEKPANQNQIEYNESLDYLDNNVKYSKYVIYIDPENTDFIESLTVKERKNLINRILREQDDIAITKRRLGLIQTIIKHSIIAIVTISLAIPIIYWTINSSLEASINNYRRSQTIFTTLYKERGKIKSPNQR